MTSKYAEGIRKVSPGQRTFLATAITRHGEACQRMENMPEKRWPSNRTGAASLQGDSLWNFFSSEMTIARAGDWDGPALGIEESNTLARLDHADQRNRQAQFRRKLLDRL
jgi:hypothetical protein